MGSLCWKAISMGKLSLLIILISFGQDNFLSATTSHDGLESLVDHLDMKFSQMMKEQQEEIKQLQEENKQQHEDQQDEINKQKEEIKQLQETLSKLGEETNHVVDSLTNKSIDHEKSINVLRSPPAIFYCGYRGRASASYSVLTFD